MNENILRLEDVKFSISIDRLLVSNAMPPKFKECTFDNYYPDENYQSQSIAKSRLREFIEKLLAFKQSRKWPKLLKLQKSKKPNNIYIDGIFGVGKTHLAAACVNESPLRSLFLSFSELVYLIAYYRLNDVVSHIAKNFDLIVIDEFELDDPGDAMMGINFIREINKTDCVVIATSNAPPAELGIRKLDILIFKERLGTLVNSFDTIVIEGKDFRSSKKKIEFKSTNMNINKLFERYKTNGRKKMLIDFENLMQILRNVHPFRYNQLSYNLDALFIKNLRPFSSSELLDALRFSYLIDTLYYGDVDIFANGKINLFNMFSDDLKDGKFRIKIGRCLSRLSEKCTLITNS